MTSECQAKDPGWWGKLGWLEPIAGSLAYTPPSAGLSRAGHCAAVPLGQKHVTREGWLHHVWVPEAAAHVPHGDARDDQPHPIHR